MDLEFNKIAASVLVAGIIAMVTGIVASALVRPLPLTKPGYVIAVAAPSAATTAAPSEPAGPQPIDKLMASADPKKGEQLTKVCSACHTFDKGGPNRIGPNLYGVFGAPIAEGKGYQFSDALKAHKGNWDVATLNDWLYKPQGFARGSKMTFVGLPKAQDRADVVAYLESLK